MKPIFLMSAVALSLIGCGQNLTEALTVSPTPGEMITSIQASQTVAESRSIPTQPLVQPTSTPVLPAFEPSGPDLHLNELIFESIVPGCALPCWRGLRPGRSSIEDVQYTFDATFELDEVAEHTLASLTLHEAEQDQSRMNYLWALESLNTGSFSVSAVMSEEDNKLSLLTFRWSTMDSEQLEVHFSPRDVITTLGEPDYMIASSQRLINAALVDLVVAYDSGVIFTFNRHIPITFVNYSTDPPTVYRQFPVEYCLANTQTGFNASVVGGSIFLHAEGDENLRERILTHVSQTRSVMPVEEVFGISTDEIINLISQDECLTVVNLPED